MQAERNKVPMTAFEVVDISGIGVDPATGWQTRLSQGLHAAELRCRAATDPAA